MILTGRKKVEIPITKEEFGKDILENLKKYLQNAISTHNKNVKEIKYLHNVYLGNHDILKDKKRYDLSDINNKSIENHANKIVNFKVGFMYGNPLDYSIINSKNTDDLQYFNAYMIDSNKASLDIEKAQDLYECGIAYQLILPRITTEIDDIKTDAPFTLCNLPLEKTCIVYSSDIPNQELFGLVISSKNENNAKKPIYNIFLPQRKIVLNDKFEKISDDIQSHNFQPVIEYTINKARMGIIELGLLLQNQINKINSLQLDDIEENVNSFMALFNQKADDDFIDKFRKLKKERVVLLSTANPQAPADIKMLSSKLEQDAINLFYERTVKALYDICATPQSSGNVTSGGDTGQARILGNGWESAQNQANVDQTYLLQFERKLCRNIISICKKLSNCPIKEISASDIAIKFNINMSNNLLVKSESAKMLSEINLPEKTILSICGLTNDIDGVGDRWIENKKMVQEKEQSKINQGVNNN